MTREGGERHPPRVASLLGAATALGAGDPGASRTFLGGLVVGALVGAALAGNVLIRRHAAGADRRGTAPRHPNS